MRSRSGISLVLCLLVVMTGCVSSRSGKVYSRDQARAVHTVEMGTVEAVNDAVIEGTKSPVGAVAGGILGGVLGSTAHGKRTQRVLTTAGALGGAAAGAAIEEKMTSKAAFEITVRLDGGRTIVIVQEADETFSVGDRVRVLTANDGTKRVRH
jgi:outer membrane lipoprotein SlyB